MMKLFLDSSTKSFTEQKNGNNLSNQALVKLVDQDCNAWITR